MSQKVKIIFHRFCLIAFLLFGTLGCDQATKALVRDSLPVTGTLSYLRGTVQLEYSKNTGAFMSLGANLPQSIRFWIFNVLSGAFILFAAFALLKNKSLKTSTIVGLSLIVGGGLGNLVDRFLFGEVTDFLFVHLGPLHTGIFNIADVAIVAGAATILFAPLFKLNSTKSTEA